jgi:hypothetical protein
MAWIMPPTIVALTPLPVADQSPGAFRLLPDMDPAVRGKRMAFAEWHKKEGEIELAWGNGFAGMRMSVFPHGHGLRGSGQTVSDVIGEAPRHFKVLANRVDCAHLKYGAAQQ